MNTNNIVKFFRDYSTARFFIPLGIILIIFGCFTFVSINNTKDYIKTEAIVSKTELYEPKHYDGETHFDATYQVYVKYTVNEKNMKKNMEFSQTTKKEIKLLYLIIHQTQKK